MHWYIDLIFGIWVYNDKLQIKYTFRSGPVIFGRVMALGLCNSHLAVSWPKIIQPERISNLISNLWLDTLIQKIKSISQVIDPWILELYIVFKLLFPLNTTVLLDIWFDFWNVSVLLSRGWVQSERNSIYTHIPKIKSISQSIVK
jgi:hypothetical protein